MNRHGDTMTDLADATIAFDLDGTLVDTAPDLFAVLNRLLDEHGLPAVPLSAARHLVGHGARAMLVHGFAEAGAPWEEAQGDRLFDRFIDLYLARIAEESRPYPNVVETLDRLSGEGARLCVCTNKRTDLAVALLDALGLSGRFAAISGPDVVSRRKPHAEHIRETVARIGGDVSRTVMVGDSATDVGAARAAGAPCVVVGFGYTEIPPADLGADALIDDFAELPQAVRRLLTP